MTGLPTDRERVRHILDAISEVEYYLTGIAFEQFLANSEKRFATIKQIEIVGEACNKITTELKAIYPEIAWRPINGFRNISIP
ncbi:MAG TPA: HepT-like ribonuclease domain-containing protein [Chitinophagaceae bacterium]